MSEEASRFCSCGHPQSFHDRGFGRCRCGCERLKVHANGGLEILALTDAGDLPWIPQTWRVRCPECRAEYETKGAPRQIAIRARCRKCSDARRAAKRKAPGAATLTGTFARITARPCGTRARYVQGCRCGPCTEANGAYARMNQKLVRAGERNPLVPAARSRRHILALSAKGVGRHQVGDASGVPPSSIAAIGAGKKTQIRRKTEAAILEVTEGARADHALVDAARAWSVIQRLLADGFTRQEIARRLGSTAKVPALQIRRIRILAKQEAAIERLYREIHGREAPRAGRPPKLRAEAAE